MRGSSGALWVSKLVAVAGLAFEKKLSGAKAVNVIKTIESLLFNLKRPFNINRMLNRIFFFK